MEHNCIGVIGHWCCSGPDVPTLANMTEIQQTSVTLMWDLGATNVKNSSVVHYVDVTSMSSWHTTTNINRLTGLTPGHTYVFYLKVESFDKTERSQNYTVTTGELVISFGLQFVRKLDSNIWPQKYLNVQILCTVFVVLCSLLVTTREISRGQLVNRLTASSVERCIRAKFSSKWFRL